MSPPTASTVLQILGLLLEIAGVFRMSFGYFAVARPRARPRVFLSAIFAGTRARGAAAVDVEEDVTGSAERRSEARLAALQGLAWIGVGFLLQAVGVVIAALG